LGITIEISGTYLESESVEGLGETREGLVAGTGLGNQRQGTCRAGNLPVGNLHASSIRDLVLKTGVAGRGQATTAGDLERTGRISAKSRPRQHHRMCRIESGGGERSKAGGALEAIARGGGGRVAGRLLLGGIGKRCLKSFKMPDTVDYSPADWSE